MTIYRFSLLALSCLLAIIASPTNLAANPDASGGMSIVQRRETIRISAEGRIYVGDQETPLNRLVRRLRRECYSQSDTIYVAIPSETPQRVLVAVSRELASHGFRRVMFVRPPRAVAEAAEN